MHNLRRSYDHRNSFRLLELSLDHTKCTKILRGSSDNLTTFLRPPYEESVSNAVEKIKTIDQSANLRTVYEQCTNAGFVRISEEDQSK